MSILQTLHYILPCNLKHYISYLCDFIFDNWNFTIQQQSLKKNSSIHSVQFSRSVVSDSATLWIAARQASLSTAKSCPILCNPTDCSPPGSSVHGSLQARIPEWVSISFSRGSSWPRDQTWISCIDRRILYHWATREAQIVVYYILSSAFSAST